MKKFLFVSFFADHDSTVDFLTSFMIVGVTFLALGLRTISFGSYDDEIIVTEDKDGDTTTTTTTIAMTQHLLPDHVRVMYVFIVGLLAIMNITGQPKYVVDQHWQQTIFGTKFFKTTKLTIPQKRQLAGIIELFGLFLSTIHNITSTMFDDPSTMVTLLAMNKIRAIGYGIIFIMYGRGALINSQISFGGMMSTLLVSIIALFQFIAELQSPPTPPTAAHLDVVDLLF